MNERTLQVLEFNKIMTMLEGKAATSIGRELIKQHVPAIQIEEVERLQDETDEALRILQLNKSIPLAHVVDVKDSIKRSEIGGLLDPESCLHVAQLIYVCRSVKMFIEQMTEDESLPYLEALVSEMVSLQYLEKMIKSKIDDHGHFYDDASPNLRSIRSSIKTYEARVREKLHQITKTKSAMLSDAIITIRNNRYVLPVKQEHRGAFGGIVHDQSSSGQTLFMEPRAIIQLNNELQQQLIKEKQEIERILRELTNTIATHSKELLHNRTLLAQIDFIYARAKLAESMKARKPILNEAGIIDLKQARHPLIDENEVVANDIALGEDYNAIVITGPNTGGKTVTLKTIGLLTLMTQAGLQIPALDGCRMAIFEQIFADIGDEQSIEQNLSTFSSHMTNIVQFMGEVDNQTLVLFDEIGAGTDPQEGAALAMAILDEVIDKNARVVATTHYPELKAYGYNRASVRNASVEFDVETLRPTYRLIIGVPGKSNAFDISTRLGLSEHIIRRAKGYIGIDSKNVENMIAALDRSRRTAENKLDEAIDLLEESEALHQSLSQKWREFNNKRDALFKDAEKKAEQAIQRAREEAEIIVDEVRKMKDKTMWKEHEWIEARKLLDEAQPELVKKKEVRPKVDDMRVLRVGDEIEHKMLGQRGEIVEKKSDKEFIIQIGMMRVTAKREDLKFIGKIEEEEPKAITRVVTASTPVKSEIDLRGKRYEDALHELEAYIDRAVMQGYPRVTIIHGKGTGALRKGVEQFIKNSPYIKSFRLGGEGEGGSGATIVEL